MLRFRLVILSGSTQTRMARWEAKSWARPTPSTAPDFAQHVAAEIVAQPHHIERAIGGHRAHHHQKAAAGLLHLNALLRHDLGQPCFHPADGILHVIGGWLDSVPGSNVTVTVTEPDESEVDSKYMAPSTPFISSSIGRVTL